jgi:hypothetical protein
MPYNLKWMKTRGQRYTVLPPFQIISRFDFFRYIEFDMYRDIVWIHRKFDVPKKVKAAYNLERPNHLMDHLVPK